MLASPQQEALKAAVDTAAVLQDKATGLTRIKVIGPGEELTVPVVLGRNRQLGEQLADARYGDCRVGPLVRVDADRDHFGAPPYA